LSEESTVDTVIFLMSRTQHMEIAVISGSKIVDGVMAIGVTCLVLSVALTIFSAYTPIPTAPQLLSMLSDGFKLCLGAVLALMGDAKLSGKQTLPPDKK
jgi:hypothetical protein